MSRIGRDLAADAQATIEGLGLAAEIAACYHVPTRSIRIGGVAGASTVGTLEYGVDYPDAAESWDRIVDDLTYYARWRSRCRPTRRAD
jgi:hypothetical protein